MKNQHKHINHNLKVKNQSYHRGIQVQSEHVEGSVPLGNNSEVLEILKSMKQELEEKDSQLKLQLQLRDEYMEVELKRRDQYMEEALKQRDEEWKSIWERREHELSEELRAREDAFLSYYLRRDSELLKIMKEGEDAMEKNLLQKVDAFRYLYKEHQKEIRTLIEKKGQRIGGNPKLLGEVLDKKVRYDQQQPNQNVLCLG